MNKVIGLDRIKKVIQNIDLVSIIEEGFVEYSKGNVVVPPVGELTFENPVGDAHIKYGYIKNDTYYVIKIASGFYNNHKIGLSSSQGLMLVFCQKTGVLEAILLDGGYLTSERTAAAGAVVAKHLAPKNISAIGILGTGIQGRLQLKYLESVIDCKKVYVWTRDKNEQQDYSDYFTGSKLAIEFVDTPQNVARECNLIVTTTPSNTPLLFEKDIHPGTHITAMGSDTAEKIELDPAILKKADIVVADSIPQSESRGEIYKANEAGMLDKNKIVELGDIIINKEKSRKNDDQITIADLTGVAVQDIQIAKAVYANVKNDRGML